MLGITIGDPAGIGPEMVLNAPAFEEIVGWIIGTHALVATVGHGSAYDIAGKGVADPTSLKSAIRQVARAASERI